MSYSRVVSASDCKYTVGLFVNKYAANAKVASPGFNPSILRHSGIWRAADEVVLNKVLSKPNESPFRVFFSETITGVWHLS